MQKLCTFEALHRPEIQCKCHNGSPQKEYFFEDTCFTRNIHKYSFKKKSVLKFPEFSSWKMLFAFLSKILSMLVRSWRLSYNTLIIIA